MSQSHRLVQLLVNRDNENAVEEISSMPEQFRYGVNRVVDALKPVVAKSLKAVLLFGVPSKLPKVSMLLPRSVFQAFCFVHIHVIIADIWKA